MTIQEKAIEQLERISRNLSTIGEKEDYTDMAIKALEQESILDKIRAEIMSLDIFYDNDYFSSNRDAMFKCSEVLQIIDKYKAESEE